MQKRCLPISIKVVIRENASHLTLTVAYEETTRCGVWKKEWKLWKRDNETHNRLVTGPNPAGPTLCDTMQMR